MSRMLLQILKRNKDKSVGETRSGAEAREESTIRKRRKGFRVRLSESDANSNPRADKKTKAKGDRASHFPRQTFSADERPSSSRRKRNVYEQDYDGRRNEWERDVERKRARTDDHRKSYAENEDSESNDFDVLYSRDTEHHRRGGETRRFREESRSHHKEHSTYRRRNEDHRNNSRHPRAHFDGSTDAWDSSSTNGYHTIGGQDFDGRRYYENCDRPGYDRI